jgi:AcrR family transcriptional regulator
MTPMQLARRQRLIDAVIELVDEGGGTELAMKDIAERAGVALGTVYRYFSSKDHLLAAALLEWGSRLESHQALRAYRRQPDFARLLVDVANSPDPFASACFQDMGTVVFATLGRALVGIEADRREGVLRVVGAVWYHGLSEWVKGRMTFDEVRDLLDRTCELLLADG